MERLVGLYLDKEIVLSSSSVMEELMDLIETVGSYCQFRRYQKKECFNLVRRLKLLLPLLEEIKDLENNDDNDNKSDAVSSLNICFPTLKKALLSAKKLLKTCNFGSKIFLALEGESVMRCFHGVYEKLNQALDDMPYEELGISIEVKEQAELMRMQLGRAKRRTDTQDMELAMDMMVVFSRKEGRNADSAILERLAINLELHTLVDLKLEAAAIRKLQKKQKGGTQIESFEQIVDIFKKFKQVAGVDGSMLECSVSSKKLERCRSLLVPHEFLCPITLEIMADPVTVTTGQTYERESIQKWFDSDHRTCPKTAQTLDQLSMAPNYALRNLILQWCNNNGVEPPKRGKDCTYAELLEEITTSVQNLDSVHGDVRREAIIKIRLLSKDNPDNRVLFANHGGIPPLVKLLFYPDSKIQEHTVTALLNLSIDETNKRLIAREGAIPKMIEILQNGTSEARENSAAALFSLSMLDENKILIGSLNGIPPLVKILESGTMRGKKDAITALFNLCLNQTNKSRAIKAGIIPPLVKLIEDKNLGMIDEALSILLLLPEGRSETESLSFIKTLVEIIRNGTPKNKECATAVLLQLGLNNSSLILAALQYGVYEPLVEVARCGTNRAQRKAKSLLQHMSKCEHIP
ncbi:hypothetical protein ACFE04_012289 [Oxalis oulophora]